MNLVAHSSKKRGGTGSRSRVSPARILSNIGLTFAIVALMLPFVLTLSVAFRPAKDVASNAIAIPTHLTFSNITDTFTKLDYGISVLNTVILVLGSTALTIVIGAMASYPLARISRPWTSAVYRSFLLGTSIPIFVLLAPLYLLIRDLGLLNTHLGVVFIYTALNLPLAIFFFTSFFRQIPLELEEAAALDGAGPLRSFFSILLPLLRPVTATLATFMTLNIWNDLLIPFVFLQDTGSRTVMANAYALVDPKSVEPTVLFPAALLGVAPLLVIFLLLQRNVVEGLTSGAVKA